MSVRPASVMLFMLSKAKNMSGFLHYYLKFTPVIFMATACPGPGLADGSEDLLCCQFDESQG